MKDLICVYAIAANLESISAFFALNLMIFLSLVISLTPPVCTGLVELGTLFPTPCNICCERSRFCVGAVCFVRISAMLSCVLIHFKVIWLSLMDSWMALMRIVTWPVLELARFAVKIVTADSESVKITVGWSWGYPSSSRNPRNQSIALTVSSIAFISASVADRSTVVDLEDRAYTVPLFRLRKRAKPYWDLESS